MGQKFKPKWKAGPVLDGELEAREMAFDTVNNVWYRSSDGVTVERIFPAPSVTVTDSTTARTLSLSDASKYIRLTHASGCAITVPDQATVDWLEDTEITFRMAAAGVPTFPPVGGVTINNSEAAASFAQHATFALKRVAADVWDLI